MKKSKICISLAIMFAMLCSGVCLAKEKTKLPVPEFKWFSDKVVEYTGTEQIVELKNFSDDLMTIANNKQKEIGNYDITISLKYPDEYEWEVYNEETKEYTYTTDDQILKWKIEIACLKIPYQRASQEYTGAEQEVELRYYDYDKHKYLINISGDYKATEIGTYIATASLIDKERSIWHDDTSGDKMIVWKIEEAKVAVPYQRYENEYTGAEQKARLFNFNDELINISGDKATEIGTYKAIVSLKDKTHYLWGIYDEETDTYTYTSGDQEVEWKIVEGKVNVPYQSYENEYTGTEQKLELRRFDNKLMNISGDKATDVGTYKAIVSLKDKTHYLWEIFDKKAGTYTYTSGDQEVEWKIVEGKVNVPFLDSRYENEYTGTEQKVKLYRFDNELMNISGDKATDVGTYKAIVSLKDKTHYLWEIYDEETGTYTYTSDDQEVEWKIIKAEWDAYISNRIQTENNVKALEYEIEPMVTNGTVEVYCSQVAVAHEMSGMRFGWQGVIYDEKLPWENEELKESEIAYPWFSWGENMEVTGTIDLKFEKDKLPTQEGSYVCAIMVSGDDNLVDGCYLDELRIKPKSTNNTKPSGGGSSSGGGGGSSSSTRTYKATITQTTGGTITADEAEVEKGNKQVFTIVPDEGYKIVDVKVNGKSVGAIDTYTIEKVTENIKITATFEKLTEEELKELEESKETTWINNFEDVTSDDWYYEAVKYVSEAGLFKGVSDTEFGANVTMNRAMIVTVLYRLASEPESTNNNVNFNDIENEAYYSNAVIWAVQNGIVNGVGNNEFAPQDNVTREQLIVMLYRYAKLTGKLTEEKADLSAYDDVNLISNYAEEAFSWAIEEEIITGRTATTLAPQGIATRAEVATMLMRFMENVK